MNVVRKKSESMFESVLGTESSRSLYVLIRFILMRFRTLVMMRRKSLTKGKYVTKQNTFSVFQNRIRVFAILLVEYDFFKGVYAPV